MKAKKLFYVAFFATFFSGCVEILTAPVSPLTVANVYDVYSISKDERSIGQIVKDKLIKTKIQSKILTTSGLSNISIDIESFYGKVYLIGIVPDLEHKNKLIELAKNTSEVEKIYTYIRLPQDAKECKSNTSIMLNLKNNFFKDSVISATGIKVSVVQCDVVLTGVISSIDQEKHAIWYAKHIDGVEDVYSFLQIGNP